jgi:hypothetical protein
VQRGIRAILPDFVFVFNTARAAPNIGRKKIRPLQAAACVAEKIKSHTRSAELGALRMKKVMAGFLFAVALLFVSVSVFAHHGNSAYDPKTVIVKAIVTAWIWSNPHTILKFDVTDDKANVVHWIGEWDAPPTLVNFGITAKSIKTGDQVTVTMDAIAKSGLPVGRVRKVVLPDGQELSMGNER